MVKYGKVKPMVNYGKVKPMVKYGYEIEMTISCKKI